MRRCVVLVGLLACGKPAERIAPPAGSGSPTSGSAGSAATAEPPVTDAAGCEALPFAESSPVPEASGAAWIDLDGKPALLVVGDSGNTGAYAIIDAETGNTVEQGKLPLGDPGDDVEGLAAVGDKIYGLTSSGWLRVWHRKGAGFELVDGPYPIAKLPDLMVCGRGDVNCGPNYEGLALAPLDPRDLGPERCAGFACSKGEGRLYCLVDKAGKLVIDKNRTIDVERAGVLADCAFSPEGDLYAADNAFGLSKVYRIDGWKAPAHAKVTLIDSLGLGFPEVVAVRSDIIYRMSDTGGAPSLMAKFRCKPSTR